MSDLVIITGSSGSIGRALTQEYLKSGFTVIGIDKRLNKDIDSENFFEIELDLNLYTVDKKFREEINNKILTFFPKKLSSFILINNAATQVIKDFDEISLADLNYSININGLSPFLLVRSFLKYLENSSGHVINIGSIHTKLTKPGFLCYATSKNLLNSLTKSLSLELASRNISINSISPAAIQTDMLIDGFQNNPNAFQQLRKYHPTNDIGNPNDLAKFIKIITDNNDKFLNGSNIEYTGGISNRLHDPV